MTPTDARGDIPAPSRPLPAGEPHDPVEFAGDGKPVDVVSQIDEALSTYELSTHRGETLAERIVDGVIGSVGAAIILVMTALIFGNAVGRYALNTSAIWADELVVSLMPWLAMCGVFLSIRQREMIRIDYFVEKFPQGVKRAIVLFSQIFSAAAFAYLGIGGLQLLNLFGSDTTLYLDIPTGWFTSAVLIGSCLVAAAFLLDAARHGFRNG
jgi:TRAP-type C4-dicarboxylate transport system permease small subunit